MIETQPNPDKVINRKEKAHGGEATIYSATLTDFEQDGETIDKDIILKTTAVDRLPDHLRGTEKSVYEKIATSGSTHFPEYYGSFQETNSESLLLERVEGPRLGSMELREKLFPLDMEQQLFAFMRLLQGATEAVQDFHNQGLLHNDLDISQFLLDERKFFAADETGQFACDPDAVKVIDFTSSTPLSGLSEERQKLNYGAKPAFSSAEKMAGKFSIQSDLFSLGIIFYEQLFCYEFMAWPFTESVFQRESNYHPATFNTVPDLDFLMPFVTLETDHVKLKTELNSYFTKAFAVEPSERFSSAYEMYETLREIINRGLPFAQQLPEMRSQPQAN